MTREQLSDDLIEAKEDFEDNRAVPGVVKLAGILRDESLGTVLTSATPDGAGLTIPQSIKWAAKVGEMIRAAGVLVGEAKGVEHLGIAVGVAANIVNNGWGNGFGD